MPKEKRLSNYTSSLLGKQYSQMQEPHISFIRFNYLIKEYLEDYCEIERGLTEKTIINKKESLERVSKYLDGENLNLESARDYFKHLYKKGWKRSSVRTETKILKSFLTFLYKREYIPNNWGRKLVLPKARKKPPEVVPAKVAEKVIDEGTRMGKGDNGINQKIKKDTKQALRFILRTGLRLSELLKLSPSDINFEEGTYTVNSKGGGVDIMPLPVDMVEELKKRMDNGRIFEVTGKCMNRSLKRGVARLGIKTKLTVHSLRHIFCTSLLKRGVPLQIVSRLMRHSSVKITDRVYSHFLIEDLSLELNSKHPSICNNLPPAEFFGYLVNAISKHLKNTQYSHSINQSKKTLEIKISAN